MEKYESELTPDLRAKLKEVAMAANRPDLAEFISQEVRQYQDGTIIRGIETVSDSPQTPNLGSPIDDLSRILNSENEEIKSYVINGLRIIRGLIEGERHPVPDHARAQGRSRDLDRLAKTTEGAKRNKGRPGRYGT